MSGPDATSNRQRPKFDLTPMQQRLPQQPVQPYQAYQSQYYPIQQQPQQNFSFQSLHSHFPIQTQPSIQPQQPLIESNRVKPKFDLSQLPVVKQTLPKPIQTQPKLPNQQPSTQTISTASNQNVNQLKQLNDCDKILRDIGLKIEELIKEKSTISEDSISFNKLLSYIKITEPRTIGDIDRDLTNLYFECEGILLKRELIIEQLSMKASDPSHSPLWLSQLKQRINSAKKPTSALPIVTSPTKPIIPTISTNISKPITSPAKQTLALRTVNGKKALEDVTQLTTKDAWQPHLSKPSVSFGTINNITYEWHNDLNELISPLIEDGSTLKQNPKTFKFELVKEIIEDLTLSSDDSSYELILDNHNVSTLPKLKSYSAKDVADLANKFPLNAWKKKGDKLEVKALDLNNKEITLIWDLKSGSLESSVLADDDFIFFSNKDNKFNPLF